MSYVHSHGVFVAIAPLRGVETHRRYLVDALEPPDRASIRLAEELPLRPGDVATMVPPDDIHSHGHTGGDEPTPYSLILTGDDQTRFARREYDVQAGTYRELPVGEFGTLNLPPVS
jgi:predicted metal-dependent enzyme (double-stranded beta helix superfamily)